MSGVNKTILLGGLTRDPEVKVTESGRKVANFTLATSETYKDKSGEKITNTEYHNVVFWGPIADVIERYLRKGSQVYVEGKLRTRSYDDKDGIKKYITEIIGQNMTMVGGRGSEGGQDKSSHNESFASHEDDLPF